MQRKQEIYNLVQKHKQIFFKGIFAPPLFIMKKSKSKNYMNKTIPDTILIYPFIITLAKETEPKPDPDDRLSRTNYRHLWIPRLPSMAHPTDNVSVMYRPIRRLLSYNR